MTIFDAASLHTAVAQALKDANVPEDHKNAFAVVVTKGGVKGVLSTKVGDHWQIDTMIGMTPDKQIESGISVKATW